MSVKGEFQRLVGDAAASLRGGPDGADALADRLEQARRRAPDDLAGAAEQLLALWDEAKAERLDLPDERRAKLDDAAERMLAVSRIILGR
ncbi:MAG: hypothetical protein ACQGVC_23405 [Myxococcota bacterium]